MQRQDTIAAIATPSGAGGIGIVRLSGADASAIVDELFQPVGGMPLKRVGSHLFQYGWLLQERVPIDEVMVVLMRAPRSYTREDVVEIQCHGGSLMPRTVLELVLAGGARLAEPGEFTRRAFFNGRIDLTRAEAIADVVRARSHAALRMSVHQLRGRLYEAIAALQEGLTHAAALLAARIDFPEETAPAGTNDSSADQGATCPSGIGDRLHGCKTQLIALLAAAEQGRILREGLAVAIVGKTNVGKSSLLNALLRENRAIVSEVPGTTRDTLEEALEIKGVPLRLTDTAGIRPTGDAVEQEGILRTRKAMAEAERIMLVLDGAGPLSAEERELIAEADADTTLVVVNKIDLLAEAQPEWLACLEPLRHVRVSVREGWGMQKLQGELAGWVLQQEAPLSEGAVLTTIRQQQAARAALEALEAACQGLKEGQGDELVAIDIQRALDALGDIVGETTTDDLLERIFAEFCIGK